MAGQSEQLYFSEKLRTIRKRAKLKGYDYDLTMDWIRKERKTFCPILGTKLQYVKGAGINLPPENTPSIDRIDNNKGYTQDNCRIISWKANTLLSNATLWELKQVTQYLEQECLDPSKQLKGSQLCRKYPDYPVHPNLPKTPRHSNPKDTYPSVDEISIGELPF